MRKLVLVIVSLTALLLWAPVAAAAGLDVSAVEDNLPEEARGVGGTLTLDGSYDGAGALSRLWRQLLDRLREEGKRSAAPAFSILAIAFFSAVAAAAAPEKRMTELINALAAAAAALTLTGGISSLSALAMEAVDRLETYSRAALPAVFTAAAATGAVMSSSARYAAVCLALDVMMTATRRLTLPLICAHLAVSVSGGVFPHPLLKGAGRLLKRVTVTVMTTMTGAFTAYIGLTGLVTASADAAAVKMTRTVIGGVLPVVGGVLSDAAATALAAAALIKNSAGTFALVAVCALCVGPFAALSVRLLLFRAAAAAAEMVPGERLSSLLNDLAASLSMLLGLVGSFAVMLFFSFLSAVRVTSG